MPKLYDDQFHEEHLAGSLASAAAVLPILFEFYRPKSVIDIGCGLGTWLKVARDLGVHDILGFDGDTFDRSKLLIDPANFRAVDLAERFTLNRRFDLAISLESAEHLPHARSESFVADLVSLSDVILFSAAAPYQGGTDHINEQWLEFWAILFRRFGYVACDVLRPRVWGLPEVEFWYKQNLMIFCKADLAPALFPVDTIASRRPLSFVHPESLLINASRYRPLSSQARELERQDYTALLESYLAGETVVPPLKILDALTKDQTRLFSEARTRVEDAGEELHSLRTKLSQSNNEEFRLNNEVFKLNNEIYLLNNELYRLNTEVHRLNGEAADRDREIFVAAREIQKRDDGIVQLKTGIEETQRRLQRLRAALAALGSEAVLTRKSMLGRLLDRWESLHIALSPQARRKRNIDLVAVSGLFDRDYYLSQHPSAANGADAVSHYVDPVAHYVEHGAAQGLDPHPWFDTSFYLEKNPDVVRSRMNPLAHYHACGGAEGRDPHPSFNTARYLAENPEARQAGMTPLLHYLVFHV
jgi:SAM-dependent methyltransferase